MSTSNNDFIIAINIRCEVDEFEQLLKESNIDFFNVRIEKPKIYYDEQTYFLFETNQTRQEVINNINNNPKIIVEINEINFCAKQEQES